MDNLHVQQLKSVSRKFWNSVELLHQHTNMISHINDGHHVETCFAYHIIKCSPIFKLTMLIRVVFPAPFGPRTPRHCPRDMEIDIPLTAILSTFPSCPRYTFLRLSHMTE